MATEPRQENPPLGKSFVAGYSAENTAYPILHIKKDPRASNYKTPAIGDPHPEAARYPNHTYQGTVKTESDDRVIWVYEILDGPTISGKVITPEGQIGVLTQQEVVPGTTVTPSALMVSGKVDPLTSGKSVLETVVVPSVFPETQKSASQPTKIPEMFFSSPVTQESSVAAGTDTTPVVGSGGLGVIEQSKQAVTAHKVKTTTVTAPASTGARTGQAYDESLHISVGYTMEVVQGTLPSSLADATPVGPTTWITELKDHEAAQDALDAIYVVSPSIERIQLPDTLVSVDCIWNPTKADSTISIKYGGPEPSEESTVEEQLRGMYGAEFSLTANAAITGDFNVKIKEGFAEPVTVELHSFYLPFTSGGLTKAAILAKINAAISPDEVADWPAYRKESDTIVLTGMEKSVRRVCKILGVYDAVEGDPPVSIGNRVFYIVTDSSSVSSSVKALHLPPTIHGEITVTETGSDTITGKATDFAGHILEAVVTGTLSTSTIAATSMEEFPTGRFLYDVDIKPIEFGYARVMATVVEITEDMV